MNEKRVFQGHVMRLHRFKMFQVVYEWLVRSKPWIFTTHPADPVIPPEQLRRSPYQSYPSKKLPQNIWIHRDYVQAGDLSEMRLEPTRLGQECCWYDPQTLALNMMTLLEITASFSMIKFLGVVCHNMLHTSMIWLITVHPSDYKQFILEIYNTVAPFFVGHVN